MTWQTVNTPIFVIPLLFLPKKLALYLHTYMLTGHPGVKKMEGGCIKTGLSIYNRDSSGTSMRLYKLERYVVSIKQL